MSWRCASKQYEPRTEDKLDGAAIKALRAAAPEQSVEERHII